MRKAETLWGFTIGDSGWVEAEWGLRRVKGTELVMSGTEGGSVLVRMSEAAGGRLRITELDVEHPTATLLRSIKLATIEEMLNLPEEKAKILKYLTEPAPDLRAAFKNATLATRPPRHRLRRPRRRALGDDFYRRVAQAYQDAIAYGLPPRPTLARDSGAPIATVSRWIKEARRLGHLGPAGRGRASAGL